MNKTEKIMNTDFVISAESDRENFKDFILFLYDHQIKLQIVPAKNYGTLRFEFTKKNGSRPSKNYGEIYTSTDLEFSLNDRAPYGRLIDTLRKEFNIR